ncbi:hypothetical protein ACVC7V_06175 [Hydrogenophaga sp. A37]|uniref:hypothetical protein n=1 Tax=Hydrogenophaga sp. A37 TaxID=1945864 RepID=UPI0015C53424|nr:hypothetical protein [Hydrogenophaga sp. A37]
MFKSVKAKAAITSWVSVSSGVSAEVHLYERPFINPDAGGKDFNEALNPRA